MPDFTTIRSAIPYTELPEFGTEIGPGRKELARTCLVNWDLRNAFIADMLADVQIAGPVQAVAGDPRFPYIDLSSWLPPAERHHEYFTRHRLLRKNPEPHPQHPDCYAVDAKVIEGFGYPSSDGTILAFDSTTEGGAKAAVRIAYRKLPYKLLDDERPNINQGVPGFGTELLRNCSIKFAPAGEVVPDRTPTTAVPVWQYVSIVYDAAGRATIQRISAAPDIQLNRRLRKAQISITWHMVPRVPRAALALLGHLNEQPILCPMPNVLGPGQPYFHPGSLLYLANEKGDPYETWGGVEVYDITYHFLYRLEGHNAYFPPGGRRPLQLYRRDTDYASDIDVVEGTRPLRDDVAADYVLTGPYSAPHPYGRLDDLFRIDGGSATGNVFDVGGPGAG